MTNPRWMLVDAGNSRLKWRYYPRLNGATNAMPHVEGLRALRLDGPGDARALVVASVADPSVDQALAKLGARWHLPVHQVRAGPSFGRLRNGYAEPDRLGVDRWLALIAVAERTAADFAVVSAGTALTFDWVDAEGQHRGGWILPGLRLMRHALATQTAAVRFEDRTPQLDLGDDTAGAVAAGLAYGLGGALRWALERFQPSELWLTGGDAHVLAPLLDRPVKIESDLVLEGLEHWVSAGVLGQARG